MGGDKACVGQIMSTKSERKNLLSRVNRRRNRLFRELKRGYGRWIRVSEKKEKLRSKAQRFNESGQRPLISILMPVYNPKISYLEEAIDSVLQQFYSEWELCIADDCSTDPEVRKTLQRYAQIDSRIKVVYRAKNGHISKASNSALEICSGQFVALLDQDDLLPEHALCSVARVINSNPQVKLMYSDEDKFIDGGSRFDPYFKPRWNLQLFRSQNLISHLGVYSRELLSEVGGFRVGFEGSQDYDLALRCVEKINSPDQIIHIPQILYHWRVHPDSTSSGLDSKPYAKDAALLALEEHVARLGLTADIQPFAPGAYISQFYAQDSSKPVAVCVDLDGYSSAEAFRYCNRLIKATKFGSFILWLNNQETVSKLNESGYRYVRYLDCERGSFICSSIGVVEREQVCGVFLIDSLIPKSPNWISKVVGLSEDGDADVIACTTYTEEGRIINAGYILDKCGDVLFRFNKGVLGKANNCLTQQITAPSSMAMWISSEGARKLLSYDLDSVGGCAGDLQFGINAYKSGMNVVWAPYIDFVEFEGDGITERLKLKYLDLSNNEKVNVVRKLSGDVFTLNPNYKVHKNSVVLDCRAAFEN